MSKTKYTYAVARIRALEVSLLTNAVIEQLLACKSAEQALQLLVEKGWGDLTAGTLDADEVLNKEEEKMWQTIREVAPDMHVFDVLSLPKLYHNLKAAIKEVCTEVENKNIFYDDCEIPGEEISEDRKKCRIYEESNGKLFRDQCGSADTGSIGRCGGDRTVSGRNILS